MCTAESVPFKGTYAAESAPFGESALPNDAGSDKRCTFTTPPNSTYTFSSTYRKVHIQQYTLAKRAVLFPLNIPVG